MKDKEIFSILVNPQGKSVGISSWEGEKLSGRFVDFSGLPGDG